MSTPSDSPSDPQKQNPLPPAGPSAGAVVTVAVSVAGRSLADERCLRSVLVESALGAAPKARLVFAGENPGASVGDEIEVRAGYDGARSTIFSGRVHALEFQFQPATGATCGFSCLGAPLPVASAGEPVLTLTYGQDLEAVELANSTGASLATTGTLRFRGCAGVLPGDRVVLAGLAATFCGIVPVRAVEHRIAEGDWFTTIELGTAPAGVGLADEHGNSVRLDAQGISLHSAGAIAVNGLSVNLTAQTALVARGSASAELSASGETVVRGAMVRIN